MAEVCASQGVEVRFVDSTRRQCGHTCNRMNCYARFLTILLLVVFSIGTTIHAANAATMGISMALGTDMADCQGCSDGPDSSDGNGLTCDTDCVISLVVHVQAPGVALPVFHLIHSVFTVSIAHGRLGIPEPHPPRSSILI